MNQETHQKLQLLLATSYSYYNMS